MKTKVITILAVVIFLPVSQVQATEDMYGGGTGMAEDPYLIYTAEQMNAIGADSNDWDKHFKLMADIDLSVFTGTAFNIIGTPYLCRYRPFTGVFDGSGHIISNFSYTSTHRDYVGLFGYVRGQIKDLGLIAPDVDAGTGDNVGSLVGWLRGETITGCYVEGGSVTGSSDVGGLVGYNEEGTISNCCSSGSVSGQGIVGGLVGFNNRDGTISNCYSSGSVLGEGGVGGLVGDNEEGTISNCYSSGDVWGYSSVGGLVGFNNRDGTISNCYSSGTVLGERGVGGLVGDNRGSSTISNCYSSGTVLGYKRVGGLVGVNAWESTITNCYSSGTVLGYSFVGGLVGWNDYGTVTNSFWDIETSGQTTSFGGTGLPTDEMQMASTFTDAGWDFTTPIWKMCDGPGYPRLSWEQCPIEAEIDINPNTLNLASKGKWIICFIWLPEDCNVSDIDSSSLFLQDKIKASWSWLDEEEQEVTAKFNRSDVQSILDIGDIELRVSGELVDGTRFEGTDTIKVIDKGRKD